VFTPPASSAFCSRRVRLLKVAVPAIVIPSEARTASSPSVLCEENLSSPFLLPNVVTFNLQTGYPKRIVILSERSESKDLSSKRS